MGNCYSSGFSLCFSVNGLEVRKLVNGWLIWCSCLIWVRKCGVFIVKMKLLGVFVYY